MIYVTGDTHSEWLHRLNTRVFPEQREMAKSDFVIILGDFGIWDHSREQEHDLDWLESKSFTTLFIDGNHENYDILDGLPVSEWHGGSVHRLRPSVLHLMRGQIYTIEDRSFFAFGGAASHDIADGILEKSDPQYAKKKRRLDAAHAQYRVNHESWWERELPSEEEMRAGMENLRLHGFAVDYILTHSPYTGLLAETEGAAGQLQPDILTDYLQEIRERTLYRQWLFGHVHKNRSFPAERAACLYEQIARLL